MMSEIPPAAHRVIHGDSRQMQAVTDSSVHLVVTSPPYWQLKDYGTEEQIGYYDSYEDYINNLNLVWQECYRVLHPGCRLCVNIGDQYARAAYYGRYKVIPIRTEIIRFCERCGLDYMGAIIWQKTSTMNPSGAGTVMGSFPYPRNGILKLDYEFILIFKKQGRAPQASPAAKQASILTPEEWNRYFCGHWNFPGIRQDKHLAMFPPELPLRLIRMFSFVGDCVLDPFAGSGTTNWVARNLRRSSVAYEINPRFIAIIKHKLQTETLDYSDCTYDFLRDDSLMDSASHAKERLYDRLPYIFKDPHRLALKVDPAKLSFGSKINQCQQPEKQYFSVKEIMSPVLIRLNNEHIIRLIGVAENGAHREQAMTFLTEKTKGQKVFLKYDSAQADEHPHLWCYLYLKNQTCINAKLIQAGLARVDSSIDFKYKKKFLSLQSQNGS